ncbi:MAG: ornithine carbamoyltransferase [bacterium]
MSNRFKGRDLLTLRDFEAGEIIEIIDLAAALKGELKRAGFNSAQPLANKSVALYFEKHSLRTRVSFEVGIRQLGGQSIFMNSSTTHSERGEPMMDSARVLTRYVHGVVYRAFKHADVAEMARYADIPVINALCDQDHPCQALADLLTIYEHKGSSGKIKVAYIGDAANNVAASLVTIFTKVGIDFALGCPDSYRPADELLAEAEADAKAGGSTLNVFKNPADAARDADIVYTDVWISMGDEEEAGARKQAFEGYMVDVKLMSAAAPNALFMHDMPAHRGEEVHSDVIDSGSSIIIDQAENRLHAQKSVMALTIGD